MRIVYRYCQPAPDEHGRSDFVLAIDGPEHPFVRVVDEWIDAPDSWSTERLLEAIYSRNHSESNPQRPRRLEIRSMFSGCLIQLSDSGWWLCDRIGFEPVAFVPVLQMGKTMYQGQVIEDFPRTVHVNAGPGSGPGLVTSDGTMILADTGAGGLIGSVLGAAVTIRRDADAWQVEVARAGEAMHGNHRQVSARTPSLPMALSLVDELCAPLTVARVLRVGYTGAPSRLTDGISQRIVSPLYYDPFTAAIHAAADDRVVASFHGSSPDCTPAPGDSAAEHIAAARRANDTHPTADGDHHDLRRHIAWRAGASMLAASSDPVTCGLLTVDMAPHPVLEDRTLFE